MEPSCPKCNKPLPEVEALEFRFCPHCGAEIAVDPEKREEAFVTIPPGLVPRQPKQRLENSSLDAETGKKPTLTGRFNEQTIEPQPMAGRPEKFDAGFVRLHRPTIIDRALPDLGGPHAG